MQELVRACKSLYELVRPCGQLVGLGRDGGWGAFGGLSGNDPETIWEPGLAWLGWQGWGGLGWSGLAGLGLAWLG